MSVDAFIVYLRLTELPDPSKWRQAILNLGLPVDVDDRFDPESFDGFVPCRIRGARTGFDYFGTRITDTQAARYRAPRGSDFAATFEAASDLRELACAALAAGALAYLSDGLMVDADSRESHRGVDAMHWAIDIFGEALSAETGPRQLF
jgi:hypothetical protein